MSAKLMFSIPEKLASRMKAIIPARERSKLIANLLEKEIKNREEILFFCAKSLENCKELKDEVETWDSNFGQDGLEHV